MVTKIGKFGDYIVGRAQVTRTGEKQTWIEHKPHIFTAFCISSARHGCVFRPPTLSLLGFCVCRWCFWWCWWGVGYEIAFLFGSHCDLSVQGSVNGRWSQSNGSFLPVFIWRCWVSALLVFTFLLFPSVCKEGESSYQIGDQPFAWRLRIVGKKLFLSTWFFAALLITKLKNAQFALAVIRGVWDIFVLYMFCLHYSKLIVLSFLCLIFLAKK